MKTIHAFFRSNSELFIKGMITVTGIALPGAILCYFFPSVQLYFFLLWRILLILGVIVVAVFFIAWHILGVKTRKSRPAPPARKARVDYYHAIAKLPDDEFENFCFTISDPAIREAIKYDRELLRT